MSGKQQQQVKNQQQVAQKKLAQSSSSKLPISNNGFDYTKYVKPNIPKEEVLEIKQAFDIFDSDHGGFISPQELIQTFEEHGLTQKSESGQNCHRFIYQILQELDEDGSGSIGFDEFFKLATSKISENDTREDINKVFKLFDYNQKGKIGLDELERVSKELGEETDRDTLAKWLHKADLDDDGFLQPEDFYNMMTGKVYWD